MPDPIGGAAASALLRTLAGRTARGPEPRGTGKYHYVHTSSTYLRKIRTLGSPEIKGGIEHSERRQWIAADGSGRLLVTQGGQSVQPTGDYAPGRLAAAFITATDSAAVAAELRKRNPQGSTPAAFRSFVGIWKHQVVPSTLQRLLLLDLADHPGLSVDSVPGAFADRPAVAIGHVAEGRRHLLVFDQETGALIGDDVTALDGATPPVPTPATISRTEWHSSGYSTTTAEPGQRPLLFLDVDGPLIPFGGGGAYPAFRSVDGGNPLLERVDPAHGARLAALPCDLVWATTWGADANADIAPLLGLPPLPVVEWPDDGEPAPGGLHWKTRALLAHAGGRSFAWVDDEISDADRAHVAAHHPAPALLHRVDPRRGLADVDHAALADWLRSLRVGA
ncbi:hypothetical protein ABZ816_13720 [Actinosynnema sp. NPDC047251]|uniref:Secreted protein n=1 Tax=Saccharothrix espanaensis (strain ATCC 51144 / DSM 44229 / JCM 9112 / NBRC 15066 / NRRL 15764) TaxID=1179773 RepID=K0KBU7_SACES|nr:hypothetical protein [Saccharothrix espanaensis]CCH35656.1 hypothetical protein BN6_84410 [Saccharothrix espanaensis DSM 44229]